MSEMLTLREAATYIGCCYETTRQYALEKKIPSLKIGKKHIILREELDNFLLRKSREEV